MPSALRTAAGRGLAVALAIALAGCASYRGAQRYAAGTAALDRGDAALAIRELERAAALVPHASEIHNHLGLAYAAAGRADAAERAFERAVALDCDNQAAVANLEAVSAERETHAVHRGPGTGTPQP